ncbi:Ir7b [Drosophila busckii]|uniref:Ir7b n=1 Tax=Drosophila busckii TaxID=30019 RepID=A0A0M3QZN4_DROBS|nr:uncharacterized protein LOC108605373 [Drosophila busckii]ALC49723.1 Ir7b [Drosophila busckii]
MRQVVYVLLLSLLLQRIAVSRSGRELILMPQEHDVLAEAMAQVLQQSEMSKANTLYVHVQCSEPGTRPLLLDLLHRLLALSTRPTQPRCLLFNRPMDYKPQVHAVLLLVDDMHALERIYRHLRATGNLSYTLIYMLQPQATLAMQLLWQLSVLNVGLLLFDDRRQLHMLSYYPFSLRHGCQVIRASVVNRYLSAIGSWASANYFPPKLRNFYGCKLTCATWPDMPYLLLRPDGSFVGIEGSLLQFMAQNLNFSIGLYWLDTTQVRATFNESGWIFEQIFGGLADYALGGFHYKPSDHREVAYSQSTYYFMSHIMLVTNLPSAYSAYEKLAFPFHPLLWRMIGLLVIVCCAVILLLQRCRQHLPQHPYYQLLVLAMGGNLLFEALPRRQSGRLLLMTWLIGALVLRSAYQSGMYKLLRQDTQRNPPQTIAEVLAQRYAIQLVASNRDRWLVSLPELRTQPLLPLNGSELESFGSLAATSGTEQRLAIITPYEYFGYFRKVHAMSRQLHLVRERIFTQQLAFYVRRHSHLVGVLNEQIRHAHAYGFLEHWTRQYVSAVDQKDESIVRIGHSLGATSADGQQTEGESEEASNKLRVLAFNELSALFWSLLWAHLIALLVLGLELLLCQFRCTRLFMPHAF